MSTTVTEGFDQQPEQPASSSVVAWIALLVGLAAVVGALSAVFWSGVVELPTYLIDKDDSAVIGEAGLTQVVAGDVWYCITGGLVGAGLGVVTWRWFRALGWVSALLAVGSGLLAGLLCWKVGELLGPSSFDQRIANAQVGDHVSISLQLRSWSAIAVWGFAAVTPVLLASSLGPDEQDPAPRRKARKHQDDPAMGEVDEIGVLTADES